MNIRPKIRNAALVGALAAVAASAWATNEALTTSTQAPATTVAIEQPLTTPEPIAVNETLSPNEALVPPSEHLALPVADNSVGQPGITVEERRLSEDERIQAVVMDRLANAPNISGKIGVESSGSIVTLSGYTVTAGQAQRAGRAAGSVIGVKYVQNQIRPRVGGSV
jgi:hypothetical protein